MVEKMINRIENIYFYDPATGEVGVYSDKPSTHTKFEKGMSVFYNDAGERVGFEKEVEDRYEADQIRKTVWSMAVENSHLCKSGGYFSPELVDIVFSKLG